MRQGGARTLLNDLITQVQTLATVVEAQSNSGMVEAISAQGEAEGAKLEQVKAGLAQLHADLTAADQLLPYVDGLEGLLTTANATLEAIRSSVARPVPWNAVANSGALILAATAVSLKSAAGAGLRNYITHLQVRNANLLTEATVQVLDDTTVIWSQPIAAGTAIGFPVGLVGSANKALNVKLAAAISTGVSVNAQGYVAA